jgi:hypothetical protein
MDAAKWETIMELLRKAFRAHMAENCKHVTDAEAKDMEDAYMSLRALKKATGF